MSQRWRRTGHLPPFFVPTPGDLTAQESPSPKFAIQGKKIVMPGGHLGGGGRGGGLGAAGIDWCIIRTLSIGYVPPAMVPKCLDSIWVSWQKQTHEKKININLDLNLLTSEMKRNSNVTIEQIVNFTGHEKQCLFTTVLLVVSIASTCNSYKGGGGLVEESRLNFKRRGTHLLPKSQLKTDMFPPFLFRLLTLYQLTLTLVTCFNFSREFLYLVHLKRVLLPEFTIPLAA